MWRAASGPARPGQRRVRHSDERVPCPARAGRRRPACRDQRSRLREHPGGLFVDLQALGQQVRRGLVTGLLGQREHAARGARNGLVSLDEQGDHLHRLRLAGRFLDRGQLRELGVGARRREPERTDPLRDRIQRGPQLRVLGHEHLVQGVEHRAFDVPVEGMRLEVQRVGVGEHLRQAIGDALAVLRRDADVDHGGGGCFHRWCSMRSG